MCIHFENHKKQAACNRKLKNVTLTENWKEVKCKLCQRTEQYFMARQDSPKEPLSACGKTLDEFMAACFSDYGNVEFKYKDKGWQEASTFVKCYIGANNINREDLCFYRIKKPTPLIAKQDSPKEPLSACGKTLDEFMAACNDDCSNIEFQDESCINFELDDNHDCFRESVLWQKSDLPDSIIHFGLDHYRIKEPTPSIAKQEADGWNKHEINQASFEPKYTITETKLNELIEIAVHGDTCKVEYSSLEQMTEDALALTSECIRVILKEFNWIRGE